MPHPSGVRMSGPLLPYQDGLWTRLRERGYAHFSAKNLVGVAACLSRWLDAEGLTTVDLTEDRLNAFLQHRHACGYVCWLSPRGLEPILSHLRAVGVAPAPTAPATDDSACARLLREYRVYLREERRVSSGTEAGYTRINDRFLASLSLSEEHDLSELSAERISGFVLSEARRSSVGYAKLKVTALRSFLRFLHLSGRCRDLTGAVPAVAGSRLAGLPKGLPEDKMGRLLASCDPENAVGCRDLAAMLLMYRLGLRSCEVAALELEDVQWARGEISVGSKGAEGRLPLPQDVGDALVEYLQRARPPSSSRRLFLSVRAPHGELRPGAVCAIVKGAAKRAGLPGVTAHALRHSAATGMLQKGASLSEIAHVLRHRSLQTTAIYAKVDRDSLRALARRWPAGGGR